MNARILALLAVGLFALNGCAAPDVDDSEEEGDSESNLARRTPTCGVGSCAGKGLDTGKNKSKPTTGGWGGKPATGGTTQTPVKTNPAPAPAANNGSLPVLVTWNPVANSEASLDVVLNNGDVIGPCVGVDVLRDEFNRGISNGLGYLFTGRCVSPNITPNANDIRAFRICSAVNNDWGNAKCAEAGWNHTNAEVHINN